MGDLRLIYSSYPGKCRVCKTPHAKGGAVWWRKGEKGVVCGACKPQERTNAPTPAPTLTTTKRTTYVPPKNARSRYAKKPDSNRTVRRFESWSEYVGYVESETVKRVGRVGRASMEPKSYAGGEFFHTGSLPEALTMAREGWTEPRAKVDALVENIDSAIIPTMRPAFETYWDVSGGSVDVGAYLSGEPECMIETRLCEIAKPGKVISILVNGFYSAVTKESDITTRGAAIVAFIDAVERMQHSAEVWVEYPFAGISHLVRVKAAGERVDIDVLMFILGNRDAFRRVNFAAQELEPNGGRDLGCGKNHNYGRPMTLTCVEETKANVTLETLAYGTPTMDGKVWVKEMLVNVGLIREEGE